MPRQSGNNKHSVLQIFQSVQKRITPNQVICRWCKARRLPKPDQLPGRLGKHVRFSSMHKALVLIP